MSAHLVMEVVLTRVPTQQEVIDVDVLLGLALALACSLVLVSVLHCGNVFSIVV